MDDEALVRRAADLESAMVNMQETGMRHRIYKKKGSGKVLM